jgi:hypothetical protein
MDWMRSGEVSLDNQRACTSGRRLLESALEEDCLVPAPGPPGGPPGPPPDGPGRLLDRKLCQVGGVNQNYTSAAGTLYHIQIEDRGPVMDRASERELRRVNVIVYANYGEANAQIVHGRDHDYPDIRTQAHNAFIKSRVADLAAEARRVIEETEQREVMRIKCLIREYYITKSEAVKKEFEEANIVFPFLFSRAWSELKMERATQPAASVAPPIPALEPAEVEAGPDADLKANVTELERIINEIEEDLLSLKAAGKADDILLQTCRKLIARAQDTLAGREGSGFTARRLEMTRNSLTTTLRQVKSRLKA